MTALWLIVGGSVFAILGFIHAIYTLSDIRRPRRLVPDDPAVIESMCQSRLRLSRGGTTMWRAWLGFNFSHSVGVFLFGCACIALGASLESLAISKSVLLIPIGVGGIYFWLSILYWFRIPAIGTGLATLCFVVAWVTYL